jgi:hypothetical protein
MVSQISKMSLPEKIASLRDASAAIESLNLPYYDWWSEATHGAHLLADIYTQGSHWFPRRLA